MIGTAVAVVTAPVTIVVAGVTATSVAAFEWACYFTDTRITKYAEVDAIVADIAVTAPAGDFVYTKGSPGAQDGTIWVRSAEGGATYAISELYIENGVLKKSKWGPDRTIGLIAAIEEHSVISEAPAN